MRNTFCSREAELAETIPAEAEPICATQSCSKISPRVLWLLTWRPSGGLCRITRSARLLFELTQRDPGKKRFDPEPRDRSSPPISPRSNDLWVESLRYSRIVCVGAVGTRDDRPDLQLTQRRPNILYSTLAHTRFGSRGCINMGTSWYFWHISKSCRDAVRIDPLRSFKRHDLFMKWQTYLCKLFFRAAFWVRAR